MSGTYSRTIAEVELSLDAYMDIGGRANQETEPSSNRESSQEQRPRKCQEHIFQTKSRRRKTPIWKQVVEQCRDDCMEAGGSECREHILEQLPSDKSLRPTAVPNHLLDCNLFLFYEFGMQLVNITTHQIFRIGICSSYIIFSSVAIIPDYGCAAH